MIIRICAHDDCHKYIGLYRSAVVLYQTFEFSVSKWYVPNLESIGILQNRFEAFQLSFQVNHLMRMDALLVGWIFQSCWYQLLPNCNRQESRMHAGLHYRCILHTLQILHTYIALPLYFRANKTFLKNHIVFNYLAYFYQYKDLQKNLKYFYN